MVELEPDGLVRGAGECGRVGAAEAEGGETLDGVEELLGRIGRDVVLQTAVDEALVQAAHLDPRAVPVHGPPEAVGLAGSHARNRNADLEDLLLVEDHAQGVLQDRLQPGVGVGHRLPALLAPDVGVHGVALDRPRPDDRHLDHEVVELLGTGPGKRLHLRP